MFKFPEHNASLEVEELKSEYTAIAAFDLLVHHHPD